MQQEGSQRQAGSVSTRVAYAATSRAMGMASLLDLAVRLRQRSRAACFQSCALLHPHPHPMPLSLRARGKYSAQMEDHPFPQIGDRATWRTAKSTTSGQLTAREIENYCVPDGKGATLLKQAISRLGLSARGYHRILKVARTIADLANAREMSASHIAEAIQYRKFDRAPD